MALGRTNQALAGARRGSLSGTLRRALTASKRPLPASHATAHDDRAMEEAIVLARGAARLGEAPVGAVVYETKTGKTIARAHNTRERDNDPCGHAEILALQGAARAIGDWRLNAYTLVVTLEPCAMCAGAIVHARVGRVVYGAMDPKAGFAGSLANTLDDRRLNHRVRPISGVRAEVCASLLTDFFLAKRAANGQGLSSRRT